MASSEANELTSGLWRADKPARVSWQYLGARVGCLLKIRIGILTMSVSREASCDRLHSYSASNPLRR